MNTASDSEPEIVVHSHSGHDPYAALRQRDFQVYLTGNFLSVLGTQMQTFAVGWEVYERTGSALALAWVGLAQFLPIITLTLTGGYTADRYDRKPILIISLVAIALCSCGLAWISTTQGSILALYACLFGAGIARAFLQPAKSAFLPQFVSPARFSNAVTWNMGAFQLASVLGPALGGVVVSQTHSAAIVYLLDALATGLFAVILPLIAAPRFVPGPVAPRAAMLAAGLRFVWRTKVILAAMTLDMLAVLLGGAVSLLPVYAKDILDVDANGLGWMRTAPAIGALITSFVLAYRPPLARAGRALLWAVAGFGAATIVFGLSRSYPLSLAMLFLTGAFDIVSVVIRHTLVQLLTPDEMRGRVSAVNGVFISASNELGGFESGIVAHLFRDNHNLTWGPTISVVSGGMGTLVVVGMVALLWPELRRYGRLTGSPQPDKSP